MAHTYNPSWQNVVSLIDNQTAGCTLQRTFPPPAQHFSLLQSLKSAQVAATPAQLEEGCRLHRDLQALIEQLAAFDQISRCPIVGITGLLNSGKSSLLATYLSQPGRERVLRGLSNQAGTHRFVLWLPSRWQQQTDLLEPLIKFLTQLFGHSPEELSLDPRQATEQYNGQLLTSTVADNPLAIPLLAFDSALDALQVGWLDCPDIQTGFVTALSNPDDQAAMRRQWLASVGRLCSAFIVVTRMNSLHDQGLLDIFTTLRDSMPGVQRILAVNRVKSRYAPDVVAQQTQPLVDQFGISGVYAAYDFRSALADTRVPPHPAGLLPEPNGAGQPIFFRVASTATDAGAPTSTSQSTYQYLFDLGRQLDAGVLAAESQRSLVQQLNTLTTQAIHWHIENAQQRQQQIMDARQAIAAACYEFMVERDSSGQVCGLRLQTSPAIVAQLTDSLRRTAPLWMKLSLSIDRTARQLQQAIAQQTDKIKMLRNASQTVADFAQRFRRNEGAQVVTPESISRSIRKLDIHESFSQLNDQGLHSGCQQALARFSVIEQPQLDQDALDQWSRTIWEHMPTRTKLKRSFQPLVLLTGPLLAALLVPFDLGGTSVLVFASTKELLAAAGIAALLPPFLGGHESLKIVQEEAPWRQLSDLFAILCDSLSLPRPTVDQLPACGHPARHLMPSNIPLQVSSDTSCFWVWQTAPDLVAQLQKHLQKS